MKSATSIDDLLHRICAEYTEMPGLRVTNHQAQRLWGADAAICREALDCLVDVKFLTLTASGQYRRLTEGATAPPNFATLKAALEQKTRRNRAG
jgi:hypothetical protein